MRLWKVKGCGHRPSQRGRQISPGSMLRISRGLRAKAKARVREKIMLLRGQQRRLPPILEPGYSTRKERERYQRMKQGLR